METLRKLEAVIEVPKLLPFVYLRALFVDTCIYYTFILGLLVLYRNQISTKIISKHI